MRKSPEGLDCRAEQTEGTACRLEDGPSEEQRGEKDKEERIAPQRPGSPSSKPPRQQWGPSGGGHQVPRRAPQASPPSPVVVLIVQNQRFLEVTYELTPDPPAGAAGTRQGGHVSRFSLTFHSSHLRERVPVNNSPERGFSWSWCPVSGAARAAGPRAQPVFWPVTSSRSL